MVSAAVLSRRLALVLAPALVLAGCAASDHGHDRASAHGDGPIPPSLLVGVENQGPHDLAVEVRVTGVNGTLVWETNFSAPAGGLPERQQNLPGPGSYTVVLSYRWGAHLENEAGERAAVTTDECSGLSHLTFVVDTSKEPSGLGTHRECHE